VRAQGEGDIRLRRDLAEPIPAPVWPAGYHMRTLQAGDAPDLHALLVEVLDDATDPDFAAWWAKRAQDEEFDPDLCFLVFDGEGRLAAAACAWTSAFVKELTVRASARRLGLGEALVLEVFATFARRGAAHVDLKTNLVQNADAVRLYTKLGMVEVEWAAE
jgi:ribosomal protein S18 acetylase RimI-like enzyme